MTRATDASTGGASGPLLFDVGHEETYRRYTLTTGRITLEVREGSSPEPLAKAGTPELLAEVAATFLRERCDHDREHFVALMLNARHEVVGVKVVSTGTLSASLVHPREVFHYAIRCAASAIVLAHNHPSGDPEPSPEDVEVTRRLATVGTLIGIPVVDHVIVTAEGPWVSFLARGLVL